MEVTRSNVHPVVDGIVGWLKVCDGAVGILWRCRWQGIPNQGRSFFDRTWYWSAKYFSLLVLYNIFSKILLLNLLISRELSPLISFCFHSFMSLCSAVNSFPLYHRHVWKYPPHNPKQPVLPSIHIKSINKYCSFLRNDTAAQRRAYVRLQPYSHHI